MNGPIDTPLIVGGWEQQVADVRWRGRTFDLSNAADVEDLVIELDADDRAAQAIAQQDAFLSAVADLSAQEQTAGELDQAFLDLVAAGGRAREQEQARRVGVDAFRRNYSALGLPCAEPVAADLSNTTEDDDETRRAKAQDYWRRFGMS